MPNKNIIGTTTSNFQYRLESDIGKKLGQAEENLLDFKTKFEKGELTYNELEMIARNLESTAQYFGEQYGLGGSRLLDPENLTARVNHYNDSIEFKNSARDDYERFYAGFVEYGHRTKNGYVPARPFMRNALYTVSKASTNQIGDALGDLLSNIFNEDGLGYQGIHKLSFNNALGESYHFRKPNNQVVTGFKSALSDRQRGRGNKEFRDYKSISTLRKQSSLTRGNRTTNRKKKLAKSFSDINKKAHVDTKTKKTKKEKVRTTLDDKPKSKGRGGVKKRKWTKKGPKPKEEKKKKDNKIQRHGIQYTIPSFFDD